MSEAENALHECEPPGGLTVWEVLVWRIVYAQLLLRGYRLRDRYRPDWKPSWIARGLDISAVREQHLEGAFEDAIPQHRFHHVIDAVRTASGQQVMLKLLASESEQDGELIINRRLASEPLALDPQNHCLQMIDELYFEHYGMKYRILVFPLYRAWFDPPMHLVAEVVPFIHQLLEGLAFLHNANIAHGDIKALNILMDPGPMYPNGFNPLVIGRAIRDYPLQDCEPVRTRLDAKPRYVYIDFGSSLVLEGIERRRQVAYTGAGTYRPPETLFAPKIDSVRHDSSGKYYDPFSADVWLLGKLFRDLDFGDAIAPIQPLLAAMCSEDATSRPTAQRSLDDFCRIANTLSWGLLARVPNPMITIYMNPDTRAECFMGPGRAEDAREYLRRMIEFLMLCDCVPRIGLRSLKYGRDSCD